MKKRLRLCTILLFVMVLIPLVAGATPSIPDEPTLTPGVKTIKADWEAVADADGYVIYWGTTALEVTSKTNPIKRTNSDLGSSSPAVGEVLTFILKDGFNGVTLDPSTTYHVAISSYDLTGSVESESGLSSLASTTTNASLEIPPSPKGLTLSTRTDTTVTLTWDPDATNNVTAYTLFMEKKTGDTFVPVAISPDGPIDLESPSATFSGLGPNTRYRFHVMATNIKGISEPSPWLIIDTLVTGMEVDALAPNVPILNPSKHPPVLIEDQTVKLTFDGNNDGMADLEAYRVYYGTSPTAMNDSQDFAPGEETIIQGLLLDTLYTFQISAIDTSSNESALSTESVSILVEEIIGLLDDEDAFQGGCVISTAQKSHTNTPGWFLLGCAFLLGLIMFWRLPKRLLSIAAVAVVLSLTGLSTASATDFDNAIGFKAGGYIFSDTQADDIYGDNDTSIAIYYERRIVSELHLNLQGGYIKREGNKRTVSGLETDANTTLKLIPLSMDLTWDFPITPEIIFFGGGGLDYWYYREKSDSRTIDAKDDDYGVGGYHGRAGFKFLTAHNEFEHRVGIILETAYSVIDRYSSNSIDLGGWNFNAGIFFQY